MFLLSYLKLFLKFILLSIVSNPLKSIVLLVTIISYNYAGTFEDYEDSYFVTK